jgi:nitroreductase
MPVAYLFLLIYTTLMEDNEIRELYAEISKRMSVRNYLPGELDSVDLGKIEEGRKSLAALNDSAALLRVIPAEKAGVSFGHAPYCLCSYAKDDDDARLNASFLLQEMSLYLSTLGFGSCWVGMAKPKNGFPEYEGLPFFKLLVFGKAPGAYRRESVSQFKRKTLSEITDIQGCPKVLEAVRLAPSAMNRQGWRLCAEGTKIRLYLAHNNFLVRKLMDPLTIADSGIALCHLWIAAKALGVFRAFCKEEDVPQIKSFSYVRTIELIEFK